MIKFSFKSSVLIFRQAMLSVQLGPFFSYSVNQCGTKWLKVNAILCVAFVLIKITVYLRNILTSTQLTFNGILLWTVPHKTDIQQRKYRGTLGIFQGRVTPGLVFLMGSRAFPVSTFENLHLFPLSKREYYSLWLQAVRDNRQVNNSFDQ